MVLKGVCPHPMRMSVQQDLCVLPWGCSRVLILAGGDWGSTQEPRLHGPLWAAGRSRLVARRARAKGPVFSPFLISKRGGRGEPGVLPSALLLHVSLEPRAPRNLQVLAWPHLEDHWLYLDVHDFIYNQRTNKKTQTQIWVIPFCPKT